MTREEFYKQLEAHDWHYAWSDDSRVYWAGEAKYKELAKLAVQYGYDALFQAYERYENDIGKPDRKKPLATE